MIGSWVYFLYMGEYQLGYVEGEDEDFYWIHDPIRRCRHTKAKRAVIVAPDILHPEDRNALIDMALDMKDKEWFYSLVGGNVVVTTHDGE